MIERDTTESYGASAPWRAWSLGPLCAKSESDSGPPQTRSSAMMSSGCAAAGSSVASRGARA